jgi:DNA-binding response OmpR family regulator
MSLPQKLPTTISSRSVSYKDMGEVSLRRSSRILVVDDNQDIMELMQELLATHGYDVVAVPDAIHAEAEILRHPPDLILSDVVMPGKSGYELCRELKGNPATRLIPFVLITGLTDRQDRVLGIESGADDFLHKPIFPEELFARVKSLLKLKEFTDELETAESVLCTLGLSVESRDPYTEGHCDRLARHASNLGRHLGLDPESIVALRRGGYLHDLGKIAVPDDILKKGSNLTRDEAASRDRRDHLPSSEITAAGAADYPQSSRTLRRKWLSRRHASGRDSAAGTGVAGGRCIRRSADGATLQARAQSRAGSRYHARRSSIRILGRAAHPRIPLHAGKTKASSLM